MPPSTVFRLSDQHDGFDMCIRLIRFIVEDDGIGMSKEFMSRLFDPFEREEVPTRLSVEGTGLGLSIVKNLADLMGGTVQVQSERGRGSRFTLVLPFVMRWQNLQINTPVIAIGKNHFQNFGLEIKCTPTEVAGLRRPGSNISLPFNSSSFQIPGEVSKQPPIEKARASSRFIPSGP